MVFFFKFSFPSFVFIYSALFISFYNKVIFFFCNTQVLMIWKTFFRDNSLLSATSNTNLYYFSHARSFFYRFSLLLFYRIRIFLTS